MQIKYKKICVWFQINSMCHQINSNQFLIVRTIPCATFHDLTLTTLICFNWYPSFTLFRVHNNNCSLDLYYEDLQTTIIFFTHNVSSHKTEWILSEPPLPALPCRFISQTKQSNECTWSRMSLPLRNIYKCKQVACSVVVACLLINPFLYWCCCFLFVYSLIM